MLAVLCSSQLRASSAFFNQVSIALDFLRFRGLGFAYGSETMMYGRASAGALPCSCPKHPETCCPIRAECTFDPRATCSERVTAARSKKPGAVVEIALCRALGVSWIGSEPEKAVYRLNVGIS